LWQLGPIWKATWRPKYDSRPEIDYNLLFHWFVGLAKDDAGVEPRGVFTARVDARKGKDCPKTRGGGPRCEVEDGVLGRRGWQLPEFECRLHLWTGDYAAGSEHTQSDGRLVRVSLAATHRDRDEAFNECDIANALIEFLKNPPFWVTAKQEVRSKN